MVPCLRLAFEVQLRLRLRVPQRRLRLLEEMPVVAQVKHHAEVEAPAIFSLVRGSRSKNRTSSACGWDSAPASTSNTSSFERWETNCGEWSVDVATTPTPWPLSMTSSSR